MVLNYDFVIQVISYTAVAYFAYVTFRASQLFRRLYIERMAHSGYRMITKFCEYLTLFTSGSCLVFISRYHSAGHYVGDLVLLVLLVHEFIKADQLQRSKYLRLYETSTYKIVNRIITNITYNSTHNNN